MYSTNLYQLYLGPPAHYHAVHCYCGSGHLGRGVKNRLQAFNFSGLDMVEINAKQEYPCQKISKNGCQKYLSKFSLILNIISQLKSKLENQPIYELCTAAPPVILKSANSRM